MRADEFATWVSRNVGKGGKRPVTDPFNKSKKGAERYSPPPAYANTDYEEYPSYPAQKSVKRKDDGDQQERQEQQRKSDSSRQSGKGKGSQGGARGVQNATSQIARNVVSRVVVASASAVVIVNGYEAMVAEQTPPPPVVTTVNFDWSDWTEENLDVKVYLLDEGGEVIISLHAEVDKVEVAPTCTEVGSVTYTASVTYEGETYTDPETKVVTLAATGHDYGEGVVTVVDGQLVIDYGECANCHEHITVPLTAEEEDD